MGQCVLERQAAQLQDHLAAPKDNDRDRLLIDLYKSQFQWALDHRNSIYQRMSIVVAFVGILLGLLGVVLTTSESPTFEKHWAVVLQVGVGLLVFAVITILALVLRSKSTGAGRFFVDLNSSSIVELRSDLVRRYRSLALDNLRSTRVVRGSFNIVIVLVLLGVFLIAVSMWFTVPLSTSP